MVCKNCGREFTEKYSKWSNGDFCSKDCARSYTSKLVKGTKVVQCITCGKDIKVDKRASAKNCKCDDCRKSKKKNKNKTCDYGCGNEAKYQFKNGKWCCSESYNSCNAIRNKNSKGLKKAYKENRKNCNHFDGKRGWSKGKTTLNDDRIRWAKYKNFDEIFCEKSPVSRSHIRKLLISNNFIEYKCTKCGIDMWNGNKITLELEHKNGIGNDNRLENLEFLCPNCHSQTDTWRRAKNPKNKLTDEQYLIVLNGSITIKDALTKLELSHNGGNYERCKKIMKGIYE